LFRLVDLLKGQLEKLLVSDLAVDVKRLSERKKVAIHKVGTYLD